MPRLAPRRPQTWLLENFGGGLDLREGEYTLDQNRFADFLNCRVNKGRKAVRRFPVVQVGGSFGPDVLGTFDLNGSLYALAPRDGLPKATPGGVQLLRFDPPPGYVGPTVLMDLGITNGQPFAVLQHVVAGGVTIVAEHVFDNAPDHLTYTTDPSWPWAHVIAAGQRVPAASVMSKAWVATPTNDVAASATALPRVWNESTQDDLVANGYEFHFYASAAGATSFTVPLQFEDVIDMARFHAYVVERFIGTDGDYAKAANWGTPAGAGIPLTEEIATAAPGADHFSLTPTPNTSAGASYAHWTQVNLNPSAAGWYRIRVFPPNTAPLPVFTSIQSGCVVSANPVTTSLHTANFVGDGARTVFHLDPGIFYLRRGGTFTVTVGGAAKATPADYAVTAGTNGEPVITFTAAPAINAAVVITQVQTDDYQNNFGVPANSLVHVPAGMILTPNGQKTWAGGVCTIDPVNDGSPIMVGIALDYNFNPTGLVAVKANSTGSSGANTAAIPGATRLYTAWVGSAWFSSASVVAYAWAQGYQLTSRSAVWDETEFLRAGTLAGADDAGTLDTGQQENDGGPVTMLYGIKNRLLVCYATASELWNVDTNLSNARLLDTSSLGTRPQTQAHGVTFDNQALMPSSNGIRSVKLGNQLSDDLVDRQIGDPIAAYGSPLQAAAAYWTQQGQFVTAVTMPDGSLQFLVLDWSPQSKIAAWGRWTVKGITSVDFKTLVPMDKKLYFRSGNKLYCFDSTATVFRDFSEAPGQAYSSEIWWHFNHMKHPLVQKRFKRLDVVQTGKATFTFRTNPNLPAFEEIGPTLTGSTVCSPAVGLCMTTSAIAPVVRSTDESNYPDAAGNPQGWSLEALGLEFILSNRGIL